MESILKTNSFTKLKPNDMNLIKGGSTSSNGEEIIVYIDEKPYLITKHGLIPI